MIQNIDTSAGVTANEDGKGVGPGAVSSASSPERSEETRRFLERYRWTARKSMHGVTGGLNDEVDLACMYGGCSRELTRRDSSGGAGYRPRW
ncbi:hypothetical protein AMJ39_09865 [candidate division TA06 bacterium DG_24]|uniref:Uncharacterized protein n=2 Tax=Bacteria division TA06 TaxID=1156500 RepID=A0A0S8GDK1_UNCT6|nr:MAG: hypothetical protein AMJ39_09865 [candidate division TA06 bacterium DG_24]KPK70594.1 MAG: hypothetical protein AMJ82_02655 [candidate division TA06 bacterium SM23_40]